MTDGQQGSDPVVPTAGAAATPPTSGPPAGGPPPPHYPPPNYPPPPSPAPNYPPPGVIPPQYAPPAPSQYPTSAYPPGAAYGSTVPQWAQHPTYGAPVGPAWSSTPPGGYPPPQDWSNYAPMAPSRFWTYGRWQGGAPVTPPWKGAPIQAIDAGLAGKPLEQPRWGIPDSVVSQVLSVVATYAFIIAFYAVTPNKPLYNNALIFLSLFVQWIFMAGWPLVVSYWRGNGPRLDFGFSLSWRDAGPGALGAIVCLMGAAISAGITQAIFGDFGSNAGDAANDLDKYPAAQFAFLLLGVFAAPVLEELAFRGLLWGALAKRGLNPWWATTITAVAFAALHLEPVRFGVLLVAGMILGLMRQMTGRLGPSMLAHIGLNAIAFFGSGMILFS